MGKWDVVKHMYIDKGIKIIPIIPNQKIPLIDKWNKECSSDLLQILYWYNSDKNINFAIPCFENDLFVIDLDLHDPQKNGLTNFQKLLNDLEIDVCELDTLVQQTPSGGLHYIFKSDSELSQVNGLANAFKDYPGIDLRNRNYIVAEPSVINGNSYKFMNDKSPNEMPQKLKEFILNNTPSQQIKKEPYKKPTNVECGDRDNQLYSYINNIYYKTHLDFDEILVLANYFNENVLEKPFPERVVKYKVKKVFENDRDTYIFVKIS